MNFYSLGEAAVLDLVWSINVHRCSFSQARPITVLFERCNVIKPFNSLRLLQAAKLQLDIMLNTPLKKKQTHSNMMKSLNYA